jgi:hypothetical protein
MFLPNASKSHGEGKNDILGPKMTLQIFSVVVCKASIRSQEPHIRSLAAEVLTFLNSI